jgi:hypothetical protein
MSFGPVQLLFVAFEGNRFKGEIWPELERLKRENVVRIIDLLLIRKDEAGAVSELRSTDLGWEEAVEFGEAMGAVAGYLRDGVPGIDTGAMAGMADLMDGHLFNAEDAFRLEQLLPRSTSGALVLIEHVWSRPLREAVVRAGGFEIVNEWAEPLQIMAAGGAFDDTMAATTAPDEDDPESLSQRG